MARYQRGQVCGVDNCPSRLWKRIDGRNVCQYGHINEFDIELDDEDQALEALGNGAGGDFSRRLRNVAGLTVSQAARDKVTRLGDDRTIRRKYGEDFRKLQSRCFQIILAKNTRYIIEQLKLEDDIRDEYVAVVKMLWAKLLGESVARKLETVTKHHDIAHLNVLNYLAILQMELPVYLRDFIALTYGKKYSLERTEYALPRELRLQIPYSQSSTFHGTLIANYIDTLTRKFPLQHIRDHASHVNINYYPLIVRTLSELSLPLEISQCIRNCIEKHKIDLTMAIIPKEKTHPELKVMALIVIFTRLYLSKYPDRLATWKREYTPSMKARVLFQTSFHELCNWSRQEVYTFLTEYEAHHLPSIRSTNIASSHSYKDRNESRMAHSLMELFPKRPPPPDSTHTHPPTVTDTGRDWNIDDALGQHIVAHYQCSSFQMERTVRRVWYQIKRKS